MKETVWVLIVTYKDGSAEVDLFHKEEDAVYEGMTAIEDAQWEPCHMDEFEKYQKTFNNDKMIRVEKTIIN